MVNSIAAILAAAVIASIVWRLHAEIRAGPIRTARLMVEVRSIVLATGVIVLVIGPRYVGTTPALVLVGMLVFTYFALKVIPERAWSRRDAMDRAARISQRSGKAG